MTREEIRKLVRHLEERAFCYDTPADYRAGVEAMARSFEELLREHDLMHVDHLAGAPGYKAG